MVMRGVGFEPTKALSHKILSLAPLTTREPPQKHYKYKKPNKYPYKKLYKPIISCIIEDGHNDQETPDPIPNSDS